MELANTRSWLKVYWIYIWFLTFLGPFMRTTSCLFGVNIYFILFYFFNFSNFNAISLSFNILYHIENFKVKLFQNEMIGVEIFTPNNSQVKLIFDEKYEKMKKYQP